MFKRKREILAKLYGNNQGGTSAQSLLDGAPFLAQLTHSLVLQRGTGSATFTRATTATVKDHEGVLRTAIAGEARFEGARRVRNLLATTSEDFSNAAWAKLAAGAGSVPVVTGGFTDPNGGSTAYRLQANAGGSGGADYSILRNTLASSATFLSSLWIKSNTGANQTVGVGVLAMGQTVVATTEWQRLAVSPYASASNIFDISTYPAANGATQSIDVLIYRCQLEDITGRADQTTPSEYVSVGVPSDWAGTELVTNGTFDTDTTGWTGSAATLSVVNEALRVTATGDYGFAYQAITTVVGASYALAVDIIVGTGALFLVRVGTTISGLDNYDSGFLATAAQKLIVKFTATATTTYLNFFGHVTGTYTDFDNISVKPAIYHGAGVDGVKYFDTDLSGNPLPTAYTYDAVSLNGVAGTYVSTPDSVAASITGDIDIRWYGLLNDWTPSSLTTLVGKWDSGSTKSYMLNIETTGEISAYTSADGAANTNVIVSTAPTGFTNGTVHGIRATITTSTGKFNFYTSDDGITWSQLGTEVSGTAGGIFDSTSIVEVGSLVGGVANNLSGQTQWARVYNGINGTLAVDFDASRYAGGTTLTGSTGETWTLQGNAVIHPTNNPMLGYLAEGARTNLCLQSNAFTTTWANASGVCSATQDAIGPDGATSAWTLVDASATLFNSKFQGITLTTATIYTASVFIGKTTSAATFPSFDINRGDATIGSFILNTNSGVCTNGGSSITETIEVENFNSLFWRLKIKFTSSGTAGQLYLVPAASANGTTLSAAAQGSAVFYGAQVELGSFASSYIPTTTAAVTRNADVLTYPSAGNFSDTAGWIYSETQTQWSNAASTRFIVSCDNASAYGPLMTTSNLSTQIVTYDASAAATKSGIPDMRDSPRKVAMTFGGGAMSITGGGLQPAATTYDGSFGGGNINVGSHQLGAFGWHGTIRNVRIGQRAISSSELQAITR